MAKASTAKKSPGKALVKWDEEFAKYAKETTKNIALPAGKWLSIKGGKLKFNGADIPGNELRAVIVGWTYENQYYEGKYSADNNQPPVCYAFNEVREDMAPLDSVPDKQSDACATCPLNEFGSADNGEGKACKNVIRLALISEDDLEDVGSAEVVYLKIPVMSVKNFLNYVKKTVADALSRPYWSVITNISLEDDAQAQFKVVFEVAENVEDSELFSPLKELWETTLEGIDFPYPAASERPAKKPVAKGKGKPQKFAKKGR